MEFGEGKEKHIYPCLFCTEPIYEADVLSKPLTFDEPEGLTYFWIKRLKRFYMKWPPLDLIVQLSYPLFIGMAFVFGSMENLRPYTAIPVTLFVVMRILVERMPLTTLPTGIRTAVTDQGNKFRSAGKVVFLALVATIVVSLLVELVNQYVNEESLCYSDLRNKSRRTTKRILSSLMFSIPLIYCTYLIISNLYTNSVSLVPATKENDVQVEKMIQSLPKNNPDSAKMKKMWQKRNELKFS